MSVIEEHKEKRRALGRGLDSLLPSGPRLATATVPQPAVMPPPHVAGPAAAASEVAEIRAASRTGDAVQQIALDLIDHNPYQTRTKFDEEALKELAESIKESGLAQPVVVRPGANGHYILVLGERRCRASRLAGKTTIPAIIRQLGNEQAAELTLIENLQREDLNCLEQAHAFARLSREFNLTQEQIGKRVGASRESIANYMRLLKLPPGVLDLIADGKLGFSEARVLLEAAAHLDEEGLVKFAQDAVDREWTVKELSAFVARLKNPLTDAPSSKEEKRIDPNVADAE